MASSDFTFPFTGGLSRARAPLHADKGTFYNLHHFRQSRTSFGKLEQVPHFFLGLQSARGTYYNAGSLTEPVASAVRGYVKPLDQSDSFVITDYVINSVATVAQVPIFYQTTVPAGETIYTGLLLVINAVGTLAITLGSTLEVVMTATAVFKWRKNGGAYTTGLVPSTAGVSIDGGNATLYFLANTGYAGSEAWTWTRTDFNTDNGSINHDRQTPILQVNSSYFYANKNDRIMKLSVTAGNLYAISVGYRSVYGSYIETFDDHLVVQGYSKTAVRYDDSTRTRTVGWSDRTDYDNFIPTDINEADSKTITITNDSGSSLPYSAGLLVRTSLIYVFFGNEVYYSSALGLPLVFSFQKYCDLEIAQESLTDTAAIIPTSNGAYVLSQLGPLFFDGAGFQLVVDDISPLLRTGNFLESFSYYSGVYDEVNRELIITDTVGTLYIYQERFKTWYTRACYFTDGYPTMLFSYSGFIVLGVANRKYLLEDIAWIHQPLTDTIGGASYAVPKITTQAIFSSLKRMMEIKETYVGLDVTTASSTYYSTDASAQVKLYWHTPNTGVITGAGSTDTNAVLVNTAADGLISYPRLNFRALALEVQLNGLVSNKPPGRATITTIEPHLITNAAVK